MEKIYAYKDQLLGGMKEKIGQTFGQPEMERGGKTQRRVGELHVRSVKEMEELEKTGTTTTRKQLIQVILNNITFLISL